MPYTIKKSVDGYQVVNKNTGRVLGRHSTIDKANSQMRLLYAIEFNPNFKPRNQSRSKSKSKSKSRSKRKVTPKSKSKSKSRSRK